jgi:hypothetical protein
MNLKGSLSKLLTNKLVLNFVSLFAFFNVIGYLIMGNFNLVVYFVIIAIIVRYFSKNMILVLGIPLILVNLSPFKGGDFMEGLENNTSSEDSSEDSVDEEKEKEENAKTIKKINQQDAKTKQGLAITPLEPSADNLPDSGEPSGDNFEVGRGKKKSYDIDYASTVEDAYDELNKILGSDGIKRLTGDTQQLMKQQMQLAESMKSMGPMIQNMAPMMKQAQEMLSTMGGDGKDGLGGIMEMAKKFTGGK